LLVCRWKSPQTKPIASRSLQSVPGSNLQGKDSQYDPVHGYPAHPRALEWEVHHHANRSGWKAGSLRSQSSRVCWKATYRNRP
jgi:hypothetical protein